MKERLDVLLVKRNLAPSREKAKAVIMAGSVYVDGQKEDKAGSMFPETASITVRGHELPYVSRGGLKLEKALQVFPVGRPVHPPGAIWYPATERKAVYWIRRRDKVFLYVVHALVVIHHAPLCLLLASIVQTGTLPA